LVVAAAGAAPRPKILLRLRTWMLMMAAAAAAPRPKILLYLNQIHHRLTSRLVVTRVTRE